jgi:hypothetical protein
MAVKRKHLQNQGISKAAAKTILAAKSKATYRKYEACWNHFARWCKRHDIDPFSSSVQNVLDYLQYCLDKKHLATETVRGRVHAIAAYHTRFPLQELSLHPWIRAFETGMKKALRGLPFEPMSKTKIEYVTYKTAFLLAITSAKRVGELQALSMADKYLTVSEAGIRLALNEHFVPKVNSVRNREQQLFFTPFCPRTASNPTQTLYTLCVRRAVLRYLEATKSFRKSDALFICFKGKRKGQKAHKDSIARWVKRAIELAYKAIGKTLQGPITAHSTRGMATTWAKFNNASLSDICDTASWSQASTFTRHYQLNLAGGEPSARFANAVLQTVFEGRPT